MLGFDRIADVRLLVACDVGTARIAQREERGYISAALLASEVCADEPTKVFGQ